MIWARRCSPRNIGSCKATATRWSNRAFHDCDGSPRREVTSLHAFRLTEVPRISTHKFEFSASYDLSTNPHLRPQRPLFSSPLRHKHRTHLVTALQEQHQKLSNPANIHHRSCNPTFACPSASGESPPQQLPSSVARSARTVKTVAEDWKRNWDFRHFQKPTNTFSRDAPIRHSFMHLLAQPCLLLVRDPDPPTRPSRATGNPRYAIRTLYLGQRSSSEWGGGLVLSGRFLSERMAPSLLQGQPPCLTSHKSLITAAS